MLIELHVQCMKIASSKHAQKTVKTIRHKKFHSFTKKLKYVGVRRKIELSKKIQNMEICPVKEMPEAVLISGMAVFLSFVILKYQDHILEFSSQITQPILDVLGEALCILWIMLVIGSTPF